MKRFYFYIRRFWLPAKRKGLLLNFWSIWLRAILQTMYRQIKKIATLKEEFEKKKKKNNSEEI